MAELGEVMSKEGAKDVEVFMMTMVFFFLIFFNQTKKLIGLK